MSYFYLILTILLESASIIFMKMSNGFENKVNLFYSLLTYFLSFIFFTLALKTMSVGWANAVWSGSSTVLVALVGYAWYGEKLNLTQGVFMSLIIAGLIGLHLSAEN